MRVLTIRQPWATLIALGVKRIETRSFATKYRGPVAIHAGAAKVRDFDRVGDFEAREMADGSFRLHRIKSDKLVRNSPVLPLGAVVAVADLTDCLPIVGADRGVGAVLQVDGPSLYQWPEKCVIEDPDRSDQLPYGDFAPGRFGWLLDDIRPLATPVPHKGGLGLRFASPGLIEQVTEQLAAA